MAAVAFMVIGATSCAKTGGDQIDQGTGSVTISLDLNDGKATRATASTARPITTWAKVSRMMILFVNTADSKVVDARVISNYPTDLTTSGPITETFTDVKASPTTGWDTYIVGNYPNDPTTGWNVGNVIGKNIATQLKIAAPNVVVTNNSATPDDDGLSLYNAGTTYGEAPEIFVAKKLAAEVKVPNGGAPLNLTSSPFRLTRAVSLVRIRVDQNPTEALSNANIDLSTAVFAIRRATTTYSLPGSYSYKATDVVTGNTTFPGTFEPTLPSDANVFWSKKAVQTTEPTTGYDFGPSATAKAIKVEGIDLWNEYMIWAGGNRNTTDATENAKRFDIVLSGVTKDASYVPVGQTATVPKDTRVYWTGQVDAIVGPNQILELDLTLKTAGSTGTPDVGQYGSLEIAVNLVGWGDIINVDVPM